jgi:UDPglucose 6-dehydrogenase
MFMKIGIIGNGFVGGATALLECEGNDVFIYDLDPNRCKPRGLSLGDLCDCRVVFVCVPTPMRDDGSCNLDYVEKVVEEVSKIVLRQKIVIRSTVPVGTSERLGVCVMPEFLTEANWKNDFVNCENWIVGEDSSTMITSLSIGRIFQAAQKQGKIKHLNFSACTTKEAELIKLTRNTFLATKVSFFNEVETFCQAMDISYENVRKMVALDNRIGDSHTAVPGPDGKKGFGGTCFPKDAFSLCHQMTQAKVDPCVINAVLSRNQELDRPRLNHEYKS